jgi:hypothetical protein
MAKPRLLELREEPAKPASKAGTKTTATRLTIAALLAPTSKKV